MDREKHEEDKLFREIEEMIKWLLKNPECSPNEFVNHFIEKNHENDNITIENCQNDQKDCFSKKQLSK